MKDIVVLKDVAYLANSGTEVTNVFEAENLADGAIGFFTETGIPIQADTPLADVKKIIIAVGRGELGAYLMKPIVRKNVHEVNFTEYAAPVKPLLVLGGTSTNGIKLLTDEQYGDEAIIKIKDMSNSNRFTDASMNVSVTKRSWMSDEDVLDELVTRINNKVNGFVVAEKTGTTPNFQIGIAPKETGVTLSVQVDGILENTPVYADGTNGSRVFSAGFGSGEEISQMAADFAPFSRGDSGYEDRRSGWFSADYTASGGYDVIHILDEGFHETPSITRSVMHMQNTIAIPTGATATTGIMAIITRIFGTTFTATDGFETADDDGEMTDLDPETPSAE